MSTVDPPEDVTVVTVDHDPGQAVGRLADDLERSTTTFVLVARPSVRTHRHDVVEQLRATADDGVVAATAVIVHARRPLRRATPHDGAVWMRGVAIEVDHDGVPRTRAIDAGDPAQRGGGSSDVDAATAACVLLRTAAVRQVGGLRPLPDIDAAMVELCVRLRRAGGRTVVAHEAVVEDHRTPDGVGALVEPVATHSPAWRAVVEQHGARLGDRGDARSVEQLRIAITTAVPSSKLRERWGDWHLASALGSSLARSGNRVRIGTAPEAGSLASRSADVHVVVRGLATVQRTPGQIHVLWVISHPESITTTECDEADLIVVASERFARALRARTSTPVRVLLQATDHRRFRPLPPAAAHRHPVTVVAKSRERLRSSVAAALTAGIRPAIYGSGWEGLVDPELVVAEHVANDELPLVYSSADVVLNDHWDTMRAWGFVSNRIFDVLACGTPVISDDVPEIASLFDDVVPTYRDAGELRRVIDELSRDPVATRRRVAKGRQAVLARHTFDHRAARLLELIEDLRSDEPPTRQDR